MSAKTYKPFSFQIKLRFLCAVLLISSQTVLSFEQNEDFTEELYVKPLPSGHINTYFQFSTQWKFEAEDNLSHTHLTPRVIAEIIQKFDIKELQISLTQGLWRYETWGYPVVDSAPGAEVWAWFAGANLTEEAVDAQWKHLASTLSGILCASLNFIDTTNTVQPKYSFRPTFGGPSTWNKFIRYSTLPREIVCTENLTPWKKLLPCNSRSGFASLLNSGFVHNTNYHSLKLTVRTLCDDTGCILQFTEAANLVYDSRLLEGSDFSLRKMFGQGMNGACPLAKSSKIYVDVTDNSYDLTPAADTTVTSERGGSRVEFAVYDIKKELPNKMFNIAWIKKDKSNSVSIIQPPPLYAHRYILSHGQERGKIVTQITNSHWAALNLVVQENIPWYVPSYIHTLSIKCVNNLIQPKALNYIPGEQRERPYQLEIAFTIPAKSTIEISFDFDYIFLKWLEYPPDASHGHYLGSAVISAQLPMAKNYTAIPVEAYLFEHSFNASRPSYFIQIRTESLILSLPTPDFSMPYNVICLACTVVALAFGPIHSVATKKIVVETNTEPQTFLGKLKKKLLGRKNDTKIPSVIHPTEGAADTASDDATSIAKED